MKKKQILITACSMDIGGIERSLAGLLNAFDYEKYSVDLLLFSQKGEFLTLLPPQCSVLPEIPQLASLLKPINEVAFSGHFLLALARLFSKIQVKRKAAILTKKQQKEISFGLLQAYWDNSIAFIPTIKKEYDAALSFMWPHHFVAKNVKAKRKIAWVHTDYTMAALDNDKDEKIWREFDRIAAVSDECGKTFLSVYPLLEGKLVTVENILSRRFVHSQAVSFVPEDMPADGSMRLLSIGRFCYQKAFDFAVEVCKRLIDEGMDIKWYIIGYGSDEELIREKIKAFTLENNFIILGKKENPYPYIKVCDIYIQASRYEGKAVTVREAQMLGKPVVITDYKTAHSQVKDGFDAIISPMNARAVADNIKHLIRDDVLRASLCASALQSDYSNANHLERIYQFIEGGDE